MRQLKIQKSITNRTDQSLDRYLGEIGKYAILSLDEEEGYGAVLLNKNATEKEKEIAMNEFAKANLRFVVSVAKQYQNQGLALPDLIAEGNLGLIKAASKFDVTKGFKFISYAVWWIRQTIMQAIAENSRIVRLPLNQNTSVHKLNKAKVKLAQELRRDPTTEEIAVEMGISESTVLDLLRISTRKHVSTDQTVGEDDDTSIGSLMESADDRADASMWKQSLTKDLDIAMSVLSERERHVLKLSFGIGMTEPVSLEEIGEQLILTRERVRQIQAKAVKKLGRISHTRTLKTYL